MSAGRYEWIGKPSVPGIQFALGCPCRRFHRKAARETICKLRQTLDIGSQPTAEFLKLDSATICLRPSFFSFLWDSPNTALCLQLKAQHVGFVHITLIGLPRPPQTQNQILWEYRKAVLQDQSKYLSNPVSSFTVWNQMFLGSRPSRAPQCCTPPQYWYSETC